MRNNKTKQKLIKLENKKTKGEVFTPPLLAEEMIASLPDIKIDD